VGEKKRGRRPKGWRNARNGEDGDRGQKRPEWTWKDVSEKKTTGKGNEEEGGVTSDSRGESIGGKNDQRGRVIGKDRTTSRLSRTQGKEQKLPAREGETSEQMEKRGIERFNFQGNQPIGVDRRINGGYQS